MYEENSFLAHAIKGHRCMRSEVLGKDVGIKSTSFINEVMEQPMLQFSGEPPQAYENIASLQFKASHKMESLEPTKPTPDQRRLSRVGTQAAEQGEIGSPDCNLKIS